MAFFRTSVKNISPGFLRAGTGERYMYVMALMMDAFMQKMVEAGLAHMPTRCDPSFLPVIGSDRLIGQGVTESTASYRVRLQKAFESWQLAGSARAIMGQGLGYLLAFVPRMRMVSSQYSGNPADLLFVADASNTTPIKIRTTKPLPPSLTTGSTVTVWAVLGNTAANTTTTITLDTTDPLHAFDLDGTIGSGVYTTGTGVVTFAGFPTTYPPTRLSSSWDTYEAGADTNAAPAHVYSPNTSIVGANWDWDSLSTVEGSYGWWGAWLIVEAVAPNDWAHESAWLIGDTTLTIASLPGSIGLDVDWRVIAGLRMVIGQWQAAHAWIRWIIVSLDATLFDPAQPVGGGINPDGTFGSWSKIVNGAYVPSRYSNARYCDGVI